MKLNARDATAWIARPPADRPGTLLYGEDGMRVALKRQELLANLLGKNAEEEMRLTRLQAAEIRRDRALVSDAIKAQGFFPGARAVLIEDATPQHADAILGALSDWQPGDAHVVVVAGLQKPSSALRKGFEKHPAAACIAIYGTPPTRAEIEAELTAAGLDRVSADRVAELSVLAQAMGPGDFRRLVEKIALYKASDPAPLSSEDIAACAPASTEAALDDVLNAVADARTADIGPILRRLEAQGVTPVALAIGAGRHFRTLHAAASDPGGAGAGIGKLRPPVFGPRRDAILRQAQGWGAARLDEALKVLTDTDLALRSTSRAPQMPLVERAFIRLSMMGRG